MMMNRNGEMQSDREGKAADTERQADRHRDRPCLQMKSYLDPTCENVMCVHAVYRSHTVNTVATYKMLVEMVHYSQTFNNFK